MTVNLDEDLAARWTPTPQQDEDALAVLAAGSDKYVYTGHLLLNKEHGWWGPEVVVEPIPGVFLDRNEVSAALEQAAKERHAQTGKPVSAGWTVHRPAFDGPYPTSRDGRQWKTDWSVFEDILAYQPRRER